MKFTIFFLYLFLFSMTFSCSTSQEISIKSTPEKADVFIKELGAAKLEKIGQTPVVITQDVVKRIVTPGRAPTVIVVKRAGYIKQQVLMNSLGNTNIEYNLKLEENNIANMMTKIDDVGSELFEAQRLIRTGSYDNSLKILEKLDEKYPYSSLINELRGAAYYMQKDYVNSLVYYDSAVKYNQKNTDAYKMKKYLEDELGVKRPLVKKGAQ